MFFDASLSPLLVRGKQMGNIAASRACNGVRHPAPPELATSQPPADAAPASCGDRGPLDQRKKRPEQCSSLVGLPEPPNWLGPVVGRREVSFRSTFEYSNLDRGVGASMETPPLARCHAHWRYSSSCPADSDDPSSSRNQRPETDDFIYCRPRDKAPGHREALTS